MNDVIKLLKSHRSIRKFSDRLISQELVEALIEAGQCAATSSFIQACTVIQVDNPETREKLCNCAAGQPYVKNAPVFLVFCADMKRHQLACDMHNNPMLSGFTEQFLTASVDCALFAQNVLISAESLGLGGCYIGAIRNQIADVANSHQLGRFSAQNTLAVELTAVEYHLCESGQVRRRGVVR